MNQQQHPQQNQQTKSNKKLPLAILAGAVVGGAIILIKDSEERKQLKERSRSTKDAISGYASDVKEDPVAEKDALVTKVRKFVSVANEAISTIQEVYNNQGKEIQDKVKDIKEESEEIIDTAKEAGEELQETSEKVQDELSESEENKPADEKVVEVNPRV
ncbi:hypothetical protein H0266_08620 [Halobacillus locisalis]|uniref:Gas vesicle protein n=1 Tax=Halobacillus locisalis TaxID=220753 RepID=A0A838CSW0_9BACI|nr:hypothetical protein [Halobacillus locisalis]MBA2174953.1 hypothetical protein [Halobacillus locisalis]